MKNDAQGKSIFQLFCDRLLRLKELVGGELHIPVMVMTSPLNHTATVEYILRDPIRAPSRHISSRITSSAFPRRM